MRILKKTFSRLKEELRKKMTKLKANFKLIEGDNGAQVIPNYKAETFILKTLCSIPKNIASITKRH
jgi:hypothetical protein